MTTEDSKAVTICIANLNGHAVLQLAIESILKRTNYPDFKILVYDSLGDGQDRAYLQQAKDEGRLDFIAGKIDLSHGHAINVLLKECQTRLACLMDSDCEVLSGDWLSYLVGLIKSETDIGAAKFRPGGKFYGKELLTPYYWTACMLLVMPLYRMIGNGNDWPTKHISYDDYAGPFKFDGIPKNKGWNVGYDTGGRLTEKLLYENECDFIMRQIPPDFWQTKVKHYGGISRNHWRPEHPQIAPRWKAIKARLAQLRQCQ